MGHDAVPEDADTVRVGRRQVPDLQRTKMLVKHGGVGIMRLVEDLVDRFSAVIRLVCTTVPPDTNNWQRGINGCTNESPGVMSEP